MAENKPSHVSQVTNYREAVHWLNNALILCNKIPEIDDSIYDNMRFEYEQEEEMEDGTTYTNYIDIYQWYLTDCSLDDVEYLEKYFGLLFTYSDMLDCFVLCVDHFGTRWDGVPIHNRYNELKGKGELGYES